MNLGNSKTLTTTWALSAFVVTGAFAQTPAAHESMNHSQMGNKSMTIKALLDRDSGGKV